MLETPKPLFEPCEGQNTLMSHQLFPKHLRNSRAQSQDRAAEKDGSLSTSARHKSATSLPARMYRHAGRSSIPCAGRIL